MILLVFLAIIAFMIGLLFFVEKTETGRHIRDVALRVWIKSKGNLRVAHRMIRFYIFRAGLGQIGAISIESVIYVFVAITIIYQLIPTNSTQNSYVQTSANVSAIGKFAAGLGEWLLPLFGILGLCFLLWRHRGKHSSV